MLGPIPTPDLRGHSLCFPADCFAVLGTDMEPLIDRAQLLESLNAMGDDPKSSLAMVLELYLEDAPQLVMAIQQASAQPDFDALRFAAHSLKSSSGTLGAKRLASLCQRLEMQARSGDGKNLSAQSRQLQALYRETLTALQRPGLV